ncbi:MAG: hypothetical protein M4579_003023 [Chaenotheca gracillima]|nr:MAG: hypothetical protein M4579_003023 [Chaenotheca gracillima]
MSSITSPRPSSNLTTPTSSRRTSLDRTPHSPSRPPHGSTTHNPQQQKRNRVALRDYYNIKTAGAAQQEQQQSGPDGPNDAHEVQDSELDRPGFDAEQYVQEVLGREGLDGVLRIESRLVNEIRSLDGERKALVYDNYSKLIAATDTIRKMRTNMDPLFPTTSTLSPAVSHIAETASTLAASLQTASGSSSIGSGSGRPPSASQRRRQREAVRYALETPERLKRLISAGKVEEARKDFQAVEVVLGKWEATDGGALEGVEDLRNEGRAALASLEK